MNAALRALAVAAVLPAAAGPAGAAWGPVADFGARVQALQEAGEIDPGQAALYHLYAVKTPERLPPELRVVTGGASARNSGAEPPWILKCGTPLLRAVKARQDGMRAVDRAEVDALTHAARASAHRVAAQDGGKLVDHILANRLLTANFSVEWGSVLTNEDGTTPVVTDQYGDPTVPDVAERWGDFLEASYAAEESILAASDLGPAPYAGTAIASHRVAVLIGNSAPDTSIDNIGGSTYAFTQDDSPIPFVVVNNDLSFVPVNQDPEGRLAGAMKITAAHEFFHVLHFLLEPASWNPTADDWWFETGSTWIEDEVYDRVDDYWQYFEQSRTRQGWADFVEDGLPVSSTDPSYVTRAYGGVIFAKYLQEHVGGQRSVGDVWARIRDQGLRILPALEAYAQDQGFTAAAGYDGLNSLFLGFAGANATMDYEEGSHYGQVGTRLLPVGPVTYTTGLPSYLGATYFTAATLTGARTFTLSGQPPEAWGLSLVLGRSDGRSMVLTSFAPQGTTSLAVAQLNAGDRVSSAVAFLSPAAPSSDGGGSGGGGGGGCFLREVARPEAARAADLTAAISFTTAVIVNQTPDTTSPPPPAGVTVSAAEGGFDLDWAPPGQEAVGHLLRWRRNAADPWTSRTVHGPPTSCEVRGLAPGTSYEGEIAAYDGQGNLGAPTPYSVTTLL